MFTKPFHLQSRTAVKSSAQRTLRQEIQRAFPALTDADVNALFPPKENIHRDSIVASTEEKLLVYRNGSRPLFLHLTDALVPTVYGVHIAPRIVSSWQTYSGVSRAVMGGADVMLPGIVRASVSADCVCGQIVAVCTAGNRFAYAVGRVCVSYGDIVNSGWRGRGVSIITVFGDALWTNGDRVVPNSGFRAREVVAVHDESENAFDTDEHTIGAQQTNAPRSNSPIVSTNDDAVSSDSVTVSAAAAALMTAANAQVDEASSAEPDAPTHDDVQQQADDDNDDASSANISTGEMDDLLERTLLFALKTRLSADTNNNDFPMTQSQIQSHMAQCNVTDTRIDVKLSSHKKWSKFLKKMGQIGLITIKANKTETLITGFSADHPLIQQTVVTKEWQSAVKQKEKTRLKRLQAQAQAAAAAAGGVQTSMIGSPSPSSISVVYKYKPSTALRRLLFSSDDGGRLLDGAGLIDMAAAKAALWQYCKQQQIDRGNSIELDPSLTALFKHSQTTLSSSAPVIMSKSDAAHSFEGELSVYYSVLIDGQTVSAAVFLHGAAPPVDVSVDIRSGRKSMTHVVGLETYGIYPNEFASRAQKLWATSSSLLLLSSNAHTSSRYDVMIQGDVRDTIQTKLAAIYGLPSAFIRIQQQTTKAAARNK